MPWYKSFPAKAVYVITLVTASVGALCYTLDNAIAREGIETRKSIDRFQQEVQILNQKFDGIDHLDQTISGLDTTLKKYDTLRIIGEEYLRKEKQK